MVEAMRLLSHDALKEKGISYSKTQLWRLAKQGKFPSPVRLGTNRNAWVEREIDEWVEGKIAERDATETADA